MFLNKFDLIVVYITDLCTCMDIDLFLILFGVFFIISKVFLISKGKYILLKGICYSFIVIKLYVNFKNV